MQLTKNDTHHKKQQKLRERLTFSKRYIREVLPVEAKDEKKKNLYINHDAEHIPHTANEERDPHTANEERDPHTANEERDPHTANEERDPHTAPADSELEKFRQEKGTPPPTTFSSSVYPQFQFRTMLPMKDQDVPVIVTVYPDKQTRYLEVDEKLARELKRF